MARGVSIWICRSLGQLCLSVCLSVGDGVTRGGFTAEDEDEDGQVRTGGWKNGVVRDGGGGNTDLCREGRDEYREVGSPHRSVDCSPEP